jgi:hypothetical protein
MSNPPDRPKNNLPGLEIPPDLEPRYTNLVRIAHTPAELVFDYASLLAGTPVARVVARLIMSPVGAKLFYRALGENLARYEATFGEIKIPGGSSLADELFRPPNPPSPPNPPEDH